MVAFTPYEGWRYPLLTERFERASIQTLAEDMHASFEGWDASRIAALRRRSGILGVTTSAGTFDTNGGYMSWNVDHLADTAIGGRVVASTQGPSLGPGVYRVDLRARLTDSTGLTSVLFEVERGGGFIVARRRMNSSAQRDARLSVPLVVQSGVPPQLVRVKVTATGSGAWATYGRSAAEASPRLSWSLIASP